MTDTTKPFVQKLYTMVDDPSTSDIIGWTDDGAAFEVLKLEPFTQGQLPTYFKHGNLSSFVRQLNTYGFSKVDANAWVFSHPEVVRGGGDRLGRIQRKSSHRPAAAAASDELPMPDDGMDQLVPLTGGFADTSSSATGVQPAASAAEVASMRRRIELLNQEVSQARAQQADTRASIGKIMEFLPMQSKARMGMSAAAGVEHPGADAATAAGALCSRAAAEAKQRGEGRHRAGCAGRRRSTAEQAAAHGDGQV